MIIENYTGRKSTSSSPVAQTIISPCNPQDLPKWVGESSSASRCNYSLVPLLCLASKRARNSHRGRKGLDVPRGWEQIHPQPEQVRPGCFCPPVLLCPIAEASGRFSSPQVPARGWQGAKGWSPRGWERCPCGDTAWQSQGDQDGPDPPHVARRSVPAWRGCCLAATWGSGRSQSPCGREKCPGTLPPAMWGLGHPDPHVAVPTRRGHLSSPPDLIPNWLRYSPGCLPGM